MEIHARIENADVLEVDDNDHGVITKVQRRSDKHIFILNEHIRWGIHLYCIAQFKAEKSMFSDGRRIFVSLCLRFSKITMTSNIDLNELEHIYQLTDFL